MTDDKIVNFQPGAEITPKRSEKHFCSHLKVFVVEHSRCLECQLCGATIDPFDFLWKWANRRLNFHQTQQALKDESKALRVEIEDLKRQERNIKSRIKRAKAKIDD
jgi:hypothetical protein